MIVHALDPVALSLGPVQIHWYGLTYVAALVVGWLLGRSRAKTTPGWTLTEMDDLVTWVMLGVVVGGRLGYMLFYDFQLFISNPLELLYLWKGGMSFHGGLLGVLTALWLWARRHKRPFLAVLDFIAPLIAPGLFFGRLGNFINAELWGKVTDVPWGVVFPYAGPLPRHPSQLYEAALEGIVLFLVVWVYSKKPRPMGRVAGLFGLGYGVFRFGVEFVRLPDAHLGYIAFGWLTMGQVLCVPLMLCGLWLLLRPAVCWKASRRA